jgi:long-chain acyl-CoA synthetase
MVLRSESESESESGRTPNAIGALLDFRVAATPDAIALITEFGTLTFAGLDAAAETAARTLESRGVKPGDIVAVAHDARTGWIALLAVHKLNAVSVGVGSVREVEVAEALWLIAEPRVAWAQQPIAGVAGVGRVTPMEVGASEGDTVRVPRSPAASLEEARAVGLLDRTLRHITLTSGTTGMPKGVEFTGAELTARLMRPLGHWPRAENFLGLHSLASIDGLFNAVEALAQGWPLLAFDTMTPKFLEVCRQRAVTVVYGSPLQVSQLAQILSEASSVWKTVTMVCTAGSAGTASYLQTAKRAFPNAQVWTLYGTTECGAGALGEVTADSIETDAGTVSPDVRLEIVDERGQVQPATVPGIVRIATPVMSARYRRPGGLSVPCATEGWFYPGDRGCLDAEGRLTLTGRAADVLNIGGTKVNAAEIDRVARGVSGVIDAAAFAVPSFRGNPALVLALVAPADFDGSQLLAALRARFDGSAPNLVLAVDAISRNSNGKVDRQRLADDFAASFADELG